MTARWMTVLSRRARAAALVAAVALMCAGGPGVTQAAAAAHHHGKRHHWSRFVPRHRPLGKDRAVRMALVRDGGLVHGRHGDVRVLRHARRVATKPVADGTRAHLVHAGVQPHFVCGSCQFTMTTVAGQGPGDEAGDGGPAVNADVNLPYAVAYSAADGGLLIADEQNNSIRLMGDGSGGLMQTLNTDVPDPQQIAAAPDGAIYIESGHDIDELQPGVAGYMTVFSNLRGDPGGLAVDGNGDVYAGDGSRLIVIKPDGTAYLLSRGTYPVTALALDGSGDLFVGVYDTKYDRYRIDERFPDNSVTTVMVGLDKVTGLLATELNGTTELYYSQGFDNQVDRVALDGSSPILWAGTGAAGYDGDGIASTHNLDAPSGLALDPGGNLLIADTYDNRIRSVNSSGTPGATSAAGPFGPPTSPLPAPPPIMDPFPDQPAEWDGGNNPSTGCSCGHQQTSSPVDTATGNFWHTFTDLSIPGRGPALDLQRTYNSNLGGTDSPFGHGWSSPYTMYISDDYYGDVTVHQEDGSTVGFDLNADGTFSPAQPRVLATLTQNDDGSFTFTRRDRETFTFNVDGQLTSETDLNGYTTTLSYDTNGNLQTVTDPAGRALHFTVVNGRIASVSDDTGRTVTYNYDAAGDLTSVTDPAGDTWTYGYDANHLMTSMLNPNQQGLANPQPLTNVYDTNGRVTSQTDFMGRTTTFAYNGDNDSAAGGSTTITDPRGDVTVDNYTNGVLQSQTKGYGTASAATWTYGYDPNTFERTSVTDPDGHTTTSSYDAAGNLTSPTDALGRTRTMTYDGLDDLLTVTDPMGVTTTNSYDADGNLLSSSTPTDASHTATTTWHYGDSAHPGEVTAVTDPNGNTTHYGYDQYGDLTSVTDPDADMSVRSYDAVGRMTSSVSARGEVGGANPAAFTTTYRYDPDGRLTLTTDPLGNTTTYSYDADGNRVSVTDPLGHTTSYGYDTDDEPTTTTRADGTMVSTGYNPDGQVISQTDAAGHTTSYGYDPLGRLTSTTDPLGRTTSYGYDGAGNRTSLVNPAGQTTSYSYDAANELTGIHYSSGSPANVSYGYDKDGRRTSMSDGTGTSTYFYDDLGRLTQLTAGSGNTVRYSQDADGDVTAISYPDGNYVVRGYDAADRLVSINDGQSHVDTFGYDPDGDLTTEHDNNGVIDTTSYDNDDQILSVKVSDGSLGTIGSFGVTRNRLEQVATSTDAYSALPATANSYGYTKINQLASDSSGAYSYDPGDNLTGQPGGITQAYDPANELTSQTTTVQGHALPTTTFAYNADGDRTSATVSKASVSYGYNQADQLTSYNGVASYAYNGDGLRISKTIGGQTSLYAYNLNAPTPQILSDGLNDYIYGPTGQVVEQMNQKTHAVIWLSQDQLGSTRILTSSLGVIVGGLAYNSYGTPKPITGIQQKVTTPIGYAGGYTDPESGLIYLINRYYDPPTAQFLTVDPLLASTRAPYGYAEGDPIDAADASGLDSCSVSEAQGGCFDGFSTVSVAQAFGAEAMRLADEAEANPCASDFVQLVVESNDAFADADSLYQFAIANENLALEDATTPWDYALSCAEDAGVSLGVNYLDGVDETGLGAVGAAAYGCGAGLFATGVDHLSGGDAGTIGGEFADVADLVAAILKNT